MRKVWLSILAVGVLAPSLAMAANTKYNFDYFASGSGVVSSLAASPTNQFGVLQIYAELAVDTAKGAKSCPDLSSTGASTFTSSVDGLLKKLATEPGDTTYALGTITTPGAGGAGAVSGVAYFGGWSGASGLTNADILNAADTSSAALICGGNSSGSTAGTCSSTYNCTSAVLATTVKDPTKITQCSSAGQTSTTAAGFQTEYINTFVYPLAGDLCNTPGETLADCCHDPKLVIITESTDTTNDGTTGSAPSTLGIVSSQGDGGLTHGYAQ
jgi:hypothetical protein